MAFSFGFYNSLNGDRTYDAIDISRIFDGVITDGVFAGIGDLFAVTPGSGLQVGIGSGKAWFNHTWNRNDSIYLLSVEEPDITLSRIDAVYIKVDGRESIRANTLEIRKGSPAVEPQKPLMTQNPDEGIYEHALAYVTVRAGVTQIEPSDIENVVGTEETPLVTSILQQTNIDSLWANWKAEFTDFLSENETEMDQWMSQTQTEFDEWWETIKSVLDTETATRLQNQINELKTGKVDTTTYDEHVALANAHNVGFGNLKRANIKNVRVVNCNNFTSELEPICLVSSSSANSPGSGASFWIIQTIQYDTMTCAQIAYPYKTITVPIRFRNCYNNSWTQWTDVVTGSVAPNLIGSPGEWVVELIETSKQYTIPDDWPIEGGLIICVGGGGGRANAQCGAGGSGFVTAKTVKGLAPKQSITVTVGAAGTTGNGGTTSFGSYVSATGGGAATNANGGNGFAGGGAYTNGVGGSGTYGGGGGGGGGSYNGSSKVGSPGGKGGSSTYGGAGGGGGGAVTEYSLGAGGTGGAGGNGKYKGFGGTGGHRGYGSEIPGTKGADGSGLAPSKVLKHDMIYFPFIPGINEFGVGLLTSFIGSGGNGGDGGMATNSPSRGHYSGLGGIGGTGIMSKGGFQVESDPYNTWEGSMGTGGGGYITIGGSSTKDEPGGGGGFLGYGCGVGGRFIDSDRNPISVSHSGVCIVSYKKG